MIANPDAANRKNDVTIRSDVEKIGAGTVSDAIHLRVARNEDAGGIGSGESSGVRWSIRHGRWCPISRDIPIATGRIEVPCGAASFGARGNEHSDETE